MKQLKIALGQTSVTGSPSDQLRLLEKQIADAKKEGATLFCTQELFLTPYFCASQDPDHFALAAEIPGEPTERLCGLAAAAEIVLIASLFEKQAEGLYYNTAIVIEADGTLLGKYRKAHIPQDPGFEEKFYFAPGDSDYPVWETSVGRIGVLICWDQWFPEAARLLAIKGAEVLFYPTAIGWSAEEKAELGASQYHAWRTVMQGHAVANGLHVAAVNRVGVEGGTEFWGGSFVANPYGEMVAQAPENEEIVLCCDLDRRGAKQFRQTWPFFRDRRVETYTGLLQRWLPQ